MSTRRHAALAAVALAAVALASVAQLAVAPAALAADRPLIEIKNTSNNVFVEGDTAYATGLYRCSSDVVMTHAWVSVKQDGEDLEGEGSSRRARSHYDTNVTFPDELEPELVCNDVWQTVTVPMGRHAAKEALRRADAYLQFCLYAMGPGESMGAASLNTWVKVKSTGR